MSARALSSFAATVAVDLFKANTLAGGADGQEALEVWVECAPGAANAAEVNIPVMHGSAWFPLRVGQGFTFGARGGPLTGGIDRVQVRGLANAATTINFGVLFQ